MPLAQCHHSGSLEAADGFVYTVGFVFSLGYNKKWSRFMTCSGSAGTRTISRSGFLRGLQSNRSDHWDGLMLDRSAVGQLSSLSGRTEWQRLPAGDTLRSVWHYVVCMCHTLSYKVLHDTAPWYLGPLTCVAVIPGRRALRSACTDRLEVPYFKLSTIDSRAFPVAASQIWNSLPETVVSASTFNTAELVLAPIEIFQYSFIY